METAVQYNEMPLGVAHEAITLKLCLLKTVQYNEMPLGVAHLITAIVEPIAKLCNTMKCR